LCLILFTAVINEATQARQCLNITDDNRAAPLPINLTSHINGEFLCNNKKPYYTFYCNILGGDLIWFFNNELVHSFQINDPSGLIHQINYPRLPKRPTNILTAALTQVDNTVSGLGSPFCVSTLTIQPYDDEMFSVLPFNVSCQTHCSDANRTTICQTQHFEVAGKMYDNLNRI
jgi:hypothetical protein